ncbi:lysylphosphatidylglycerol synthase domain-containing protein [Perlabentimonas gracilis]|uniref:lysylphosphatidylglycerol synthase domain-containing protein n=1 Tax=Perlabentimonas gracilis TaxID=2715279 RepID=UPI001409CDDB|nr:lysylphosphatidylglycerol synthase domain-containing protein [Perlabentimonas gracilis]NHB68456.1 flippase-like domain-containing protein [Perlabentimonas gracilis]
MRKWFFNILIYLSLIFLVVYLFRYNYVDLKGIRFNYWYLSLSCILLWIGFIASALAWRKCLVLHNMPVSGVKAVVSHGLSVFAKFIPGKVWVVLGRASKVSSEGVSLKTASYASLKEQLVYIWLGLALGSFFLLFQNGNWELLLIVFTLFLGLTVFNLSDWFRRLVALAYKKITKHEFDIPRISAKEIIALAGSVAIYWVLWSAGFWFFTKSIIADISPFVAFAFPLSVTLGLLAIIVPGGLGVREGLMVVGLTALGTPIDVAATISIAARLWFLSGEVFIFLLGLSVNVSQKQTLQKKGNADAPPL